MKLQIKDHLLRLSCEERVRPLTLKHPFTMYTIKIQVILPYILPILEIKLIVKYHLPFLVVVI